jgi:hypothetical protein
MCKHLLIILCLAFAFPLFSQNVGVGLMTPLSKLHVKGGANVPQLTIDGHTTQSNTNPLIRLRNGSSADLMWIHADHASNVFLGLNAGRVNNYGAGGMYNILIGRDAGYSNTTGSTLIAIGERAAYANTIGHSNIAIGNLALTANTAMGGNTAIGNEALYLQSFSNGGTPYTSGNVAIGTHSLRSNNPTAVGNGNKNTGLGYNTLYSNTVGSGNTAAGHGAMESNTTGNNNSAYGHNALFQSLTGASNTSIGHFSMYFNRAGNNAVAIGANSQYFINNTVTPWDNTNTSVGYQSLFGSNTPANNTGVANTTIGRNSMYSNSSGNNNTASGLEALYTNTTGSFNSAVGSQVMLQNTTGGNNAAHGHRALYHNRAGNNGVAIGYFSQHNVNSTTTPWDNTNTAVGTQSLYGSATPANNTGTANTVIGRNTLFSNSSGSNNTVAGYLTMQGNTTGSHNCAIGSHALLLNTSGIDNVAIGTQTLSSNTIGQGNTAVGSEALRYSSNAFFNTAIGKLSLFNNTTGGDNTGAGKQALYFNETGNYNTAVGSNALHANVAGNYGVAIGYYSQFNSNNTLSLWTNTNTSGGYNSLRGSAVPANNTGKRNTAIGWESLSVNSSGENNTAIGYNTLIDNQTGVENTAVGASALAQNTTGLHNTSLGFDAGGSQSTGNDCTFLGYSAEGSSGTFVNATAIGYQAAVGGSNEIRIGNSVISEIGGYEPWTNVSDGRYKKNISEHVAGLDFILKLRPVTYNLEVNKLAAHLKEDEHRDSDGNVVYRSPDQLTKESRDKKESILYSGFIAQEVETAAGLTGYDFSGISKPQNKDDLYGLSYAEFVVPLVKAVQELSTENQLLTDGNKALLLLSQQLETKNAEQDALIASLISRLERLEKKD